MWVNTHSLLSKRLLFTHTHTHKQLHAPQLALNNRQHFLKVKNNREQFPSAVTVEQDTNTHHLKVHVPWKESERHVSSCANLLTPTVYCALWNKPVDHLFLFILSSVRGEASSAWTLSDTLKNIYVTQRRRTAFTFLAIGPVRNENCHKSQWKPT